MRATFRAGPATGYDGGCNSSNLNGKTTKAATMSTEGRNPDPRPKSEFLQQAQAEQPGLIREFIDFLKFNKAWWLTPIILVLLLVGGLMVLAATGAAPFIYAIF
jgi:Family of unknown function (DUF5989)